MPGLLDFIPFLLLDVAIFVVLHLIRTQDIIFTLPISTFLNSFKGQILLLHLAKSGGAPPYTTSQNRRSDPTISFLSTFDFQNFF